MKVKTKKENVPVRTISANELTDVKDIKGKFLYTKSGYLFTYLRIHTFNLELLSREECQLITQNLSLSFQTDRGNFTYFAFPREIDLDQYKNFLKKKHQSEIDNLGKRQILGIMMKTAQELSTLGENFEHQHFIKLWRLIGAHEAEVKHDLLERSSEFKEKFDAVGIKTEILNENEIIKLCNLFGNSEQVTYETGELNNMYTPIAQIR